MRIMTFNANGIRAAARKGFFDWLPKAKADVVCVQETKAQLAQLTAPEFHPNGYHCFYHDAEKKGYSGVAVYSRIEPRVVRYGIGWEVMDGEGRWLRVDFDSLSVISLYLPSGTSGDQRQQVKYRMMDHLEPVLRRMVEDDREYVICGDWNIAHKEIDLKNYRSNRKNSGFLPEERAWLDTVFGQVGMVDSFRTVDARAEQYTWWSHRGQAWTNNTGWRIDYQVATPGIGVRARRAQIHTEDRFSDHAPLTMEFEWTPD